LNDTLRVAERLDDTPETIPLKFYCHRYLGISHLRDTVARSAENANRHFQRARQYAESRQLSDDQRRPLLARVEGNLGYLALELKRFDEALERFEQELRLYLELGDAEHIGIAHLKIAQGLIARGTGDWDSAQDHLDKAEHAAVESRWVEGRGRIWEQRAQLYARMAEDARRAEKSSGR
jgi:tetratricopeptide (TPR) repeat protein